MEMLAWLIGIVGVLIIPWWNERKMREFEEIEEQYEDEHEGELYGTVVMHVDSDGEVDIQDWKEK